jgi:hypothetical protein
MVMFDVGLLTQSATPISKEQEHPIPFSQAICSAKLLMTIVTGKK